jgi:hypothetical protein
LLVVAALTPVILVLTDPNRVAALELSGSNDGGSGDAPHIRSRQLLQEQEEMWMRSRANNQIIENLAAGRLSFPEALGVYRAINQPVPGFVQAVTERWGLEDAEACTRLNLLNLVRMSLDGDPALREAVTARLIAEYEAAFGSLPVSPAGLDR